jgi:tRNA U34 5-carboxymethylaminomethyl modifying GTPase MnmE/TrmE
MNETSFYPTDSIIALATPWGESALAVIRLSGKDSLGLLDSLFRPASAGLGTLGSCPGHTLHRGAILAGGGTARSIGDRRASPVRMGRKFFVTAAR